MTLQPGTRLGPYQVTAAIGAGGMGEVYRGRDAVLNRDVAIKVLPAALAADTARLARFKREAQVPAALADYLSLSRNGRALSVEHEVLDSDIWLLELP